MLSIEKKEQAVTDEDVSYYGGRFRPGDRVWFLRTLKGTVADAQEDYPWWSVPVLLDNGAKLYTLCHGGALEKVEPPHPVATIGGDGPSGVWQPTGEKFEVMFNRTGPVGQFFLRERVTSDE